MAVEDKTVIFKVTVEADGATATIRDLNGRIVSTQVSVSELRKEFGNFSVSAKKSTEIVGKSFSDLKGKVDAAKRPMTDLSKGLDGVSKSSGAAAATTLELGRVISDAPYGIRGMANNVSQVASQMAFMSRSTDAATGKVLGFGGALGAIGKQIMGPLGILLAIQAVIAAVDFFWGSTAKATDEVDNLNNSLDEQITKFNMLNEVLNEPRLGIVDKLLGVSWKDDLKILNNEFGEFGRKYASLSDAERNDEGLAKKYLADYKNLLFVRGKITQEAKELKELEADGSNEVGRMQALRDSLKANYLIKAELEEIFKVEKKLGKATSRRTKEYHQQLLDLNKFVLKQQEEEFNFTERNEWKLLQSKQEFEKKELKATRDAYLAKNKVRFDNFMKEAKDEDARNRARAEYREANGVAELEYQNAQNALENKQIAEDNEFKRALEEKHLQSMAKLKEKSSAGELNASKKLYGTEAGSVGSPVDKAGAEGFGTLEEAYKAAGVVSDEAFQTALSLKEEQLRLSGLSEEQVKAEIAEMSYQNELERVQREIDLEKMKIDAKKNINQEYVSWVSGLSSVFQGIAGENEALAKAALVLEKGAAIAGIVISTQAANAKIIAGTSTEVSALRAQAALAGPAGIGLYAKAVAAEAAGKKRILKNNIGSGISIAKILATTLSSGGSSSGGSGGGGGGAESQDRTFDFNLVGNTGVNQLAQGIAGQFSGPIQAYVVASQVTSQQQLDATIQSNATIG